MNRYQRPAWGVLVVDDSASFLRAAGRLIDSVPGFHLLAQASSWNEALRMVEEQRPDLVLVDVRMPEVDGIGVAARIHELRPETAVVLISTSEEADLPSRAQHCGALAYISKQRLNAATLGELAPLIARIR